MSTRKVIGLDLGQAQDPTRWPFWNVFPYRNRPA